MEAEWYIPNENYALTYSGRFIAFYLKNIE